MLPSKSAASRRRRLAVLAALGALALAVRARAAGAPDFDASNEPFTPKEFAAEVARTTSDCTVSQLVGPSDVPLPLDLSNDLLDHPDLSAFIVRRRKIAPYQIEMRGPRRSRADDGEGTSGIVNLLERTDTHRLYYGEGEHRSGLFPVILASAVITMDLEERKGADGRPVTRTSFLVCVRMRSRFVSGMVKVLRPFVQKTVIGKFTKAFFVADRVGNLMASDPAGFSADIGAFPAFSDEDLAALRARVARLPPPPPAPAK